MDKNCTLLNWLPYSLFFIIRLYFQGLQLDDLLSQFLDAFRVVHVGHEVQDISNTVDVGLTHSSMRAL